MNSLEKFGRFKINILENEYEGKFLNSSSYESVIKIIIDNKTDMSHFKPLIDWSDSIWKGEQVKFKSEYAKDLCIIKNGYRLALLCCYPIVNTDSDKYKIYINFDFVKSSKMQEI